MIQLKKTSLALVSAGLLALALPAVSHADVMASSVVNMTNFLIINDTTGQTLNAAGTDDTISGNETGDLSSLTFTSTGGYAIDLNGTKASNSSSAAPVDFAKACVGSGCTTWNTDYGVNNSYTKLTSTSVDNYAAADQSESGAPIAGLTAFSTPANVANASYASLTTESGLSSSDANNNLNSSFVFKLNSDTTLTFSFDVNAYLQAYVDNTEGFPGFATASYTMDFTITNLSVAGTPTVWSFAPDLFGDGTDTLSLNAPLPVSVESTRSTAGPISFSSQTALLTAGNLYQLSARIVTNVDASRVQRVPEPGVLALVGLGLLGLGLSRRRAV